ncbi:MAG TPA: NAD-dependent epimerase/dehydratase family protein [Acidimicrobiia bacterium]|nr:NAD-dependent epimerase/dehydratase family protein [Acidimicrobiia bacterium]
MRLLVLGGTSFAGRRVVECALAEGHSVTTFNRGRTNPDLFSGAVRSLHGDRTAGDYGGLVGAGPFDAVVDMCAYVPRAIRETVAALGPGGLGGPYVVISSVSAYAEPQPGADVHGFTEESPLASLPDGADPSDEDVTGETYGPLKVLTEQVAEQLLPGQVMIVRPGLIVGPYDPTDRFTYWVRRMARGGIVLAPESPAVARTQVIDAADMARWIVVSAAAGRTGVYNAVAPPVPLARVLDAARTDADAEVVWVPWEFLEAEGVQPWTDLPAWVPAPMAAVLMADGSKAAAAGLDSRPIEAVVADLAEWDRARNDEPLRAGLSGEREAELLRKFAAAGPPPGP